MKRFPKLKYPSDSETDGVLDGEVVVTEKLDGANFRLEVTEGEEVYIGTRNHKYHIDGDGIPVAFDHAVEWVRENIVNDDTARRTLSGVGTLFGEAMHLHSLEYDVDYMNPSRGSPYFGEGYPNVVFYDWYMSSGTDIDPAYEEAYSDWANWNTFVDLTSTVGLPTTIVIARGHGEELRQNGDLAIPDESMFGNHPEGIVVRRVDGSVRAKKVSDDFKETNAQAFDDPSKAQGDASEFVAAFITKPRIEKTANKLVDEGEYDQLEMPMMEDLPREVVKDAFSEVGWSRLINGEFEAEWDDEFKDEVRSKASKKCSRTLRQLCQEF